MSKKVVVCVTRQKNCRRLIQYAADITKGSEDASVTVVHVVKHGRNFLDTDREGQALEFLFQTAKEYDADMYVLRSDDIADSLAEYARENNADCMILGRSPEQQNPYLYRLRERLSGVEFIEI